MLLFGLIRLFERNRREIDGFDIVLAAVAPVIVLLLARGGGSILNLGVLGEYVALVLFMAAIVLVLWKMAKIPLKHSVIYGLVVVLVNIALSIALMGGAPA